VVRVIAAMLDGILDACRSAVAQIVEARR